MQHLKRLWAAWKRIAHAIGNFQARILLTIIYAVLILPFGLAVRFFSDSLSTKKRPAFDTQAKPQPERAVFTGAVHTIERTRATEAEREPWSVRDLTAAKLEVELRSEEHT